MVTPSVFMANIKIAALEIDGVELEYPAERDLSAEDTTFNDSEYSSTKVGPALREILFGKRYQNVLVAAETSTTSNSVFSTKATITTPDLPSGNYRLSWSFKWRASAANRGIRYRIQNNSVTNLEAIEFAASASAKPNAAGTTIFENLSGVNNITLGFNIGVGSGTVYMSNVVFEFWRIS